MTTPIKKIIIHVDFSQKALNALHTAIQIAVRHSATLHLLYVMDNYEEEGKRDMVFLKNLASSIAQEKGIACECQCRIGLVVHSLAEAARELDCDLVVVPSDEHGDGDAYSVLKNVNCSLLTVPSTKKIKSFKNIMFPIRTMHDNHSKYTFSRAIFKRNKARVTLMSKNKTVLSPVMQQFRQWLQEDKIPHVAKVTANADLLTGADLHTDLVIINASTKRNLLQFFFGSYTQKMIQRSDFAVLCYQPKKQIDESWETATHGVQLAFG